MSSRASRTLYVGNLPGDIREREVEDLFYKYGPIAHIDLKIPPRPPGYAFIEFEEARDAEDAIRGRDGYDFDGHRLRVELAHGGRGRSSSDRHSSYSSGRGRGVSRRSEYRVLVTGLPSSASWQDLKDHMRRAGDVCFSQVFRDGSGKIFRDMLVLYFPLCFSIYGDCFAGTTGIVDYTNYDDMKHAIKKLNDSEFRNAFSRSYVRVSETTLKALVEADLFQKTGVKAAAVVVVVVEVTVGAGAGDNAANLPKPNLRVALLLDLDRGLFLLALALDQNHDLCQDNGYMLRNGDWILGLDGIWFNCLQSFGCGDWEQRREWIAIIELDFSELSATGIWKSPSVSGRNKFIVIFCSNKIAKLIGCAIWILLDFLWYYRVSQSRSRSPLPPVRMVFGDLWMLWMWEKFHFALVVILELFLTLRCVGILELRYRVAMVMIQDKALKLVRLGVTSFLWTYLC
ncbi:hypothetical protein Pint_00976 [Pistacia integerrima]|uniref:Uncharacterized protein n=1 Tax=Pistacia integerrima TaxID=434235 RepID=A0ACC0ZNF6_9ROSI|nr:hypothetical protein Pint_00976 [Pistacia integerrima]